MDAFSKRLKSSMNQYFDKSDKSKEEVEKSPTMSNNNQEEQKKKKKISAEEKVSWRSFCFSSSIMNQFVVRDAFSLVRAWYSFSFPLPDNRDAV